MERKIIKTVIGFFILVSLTLLSLLVLNLAGYDISAYEIGYATGRFLRSVVNLF